MVLIVAAGILLLMVNFITDWMWFAEMKYVDVFFKGLYTQIKIGIPIFVVVMLLLEYYLRRLRKDYFAKIASHEETNMKRLGLLTTFMAFGFSVIMAFFAANRLWFKTLEFTHSTSFGKKDPLFGFDISFYIFKLEFLQGLNEILLVIILLMVVLTVLYYILLLVMHSPDVVNYDDYADFTEEENSSFQNPFGNTGVLGKIFEGVAKNKRQSKPKKSFNNSNYRNLLEIASHQLTVLGVVFFLMLGANFFLKQFDLLHEHTGAVYGAGFTDVNVTLWVYRVLILLSAAGIVFTIVFIKKKSFKNLVKVPVVMVGVWLLGVGLATVVQFWVGSDEINKEEKYLARNIEYTQSAYQLNDVSVKKFSADENLTGADIAANKDTISNVRINDYSPVKTFYNQTQSIRQYYKFNDVDVDRYNINGNLTQTYLATREIDENKISDTWLNRHIKYTHGYGVTLSKVNTVTASGQPDVLIKNIPPESSVREIDIKQPRIYFGELTNDYSLVNTSEDEFDYPDGTENKYTRYDGKAGIRMNLFNRIMFAIREGSFKMLISSNIKSDSKIIIYRNVEERIKKIMPYLSYEDDPYAVTANGRIYWIVDAYTTSSYYPYSEPYSQNAGDTNYIRNSIKVVVDAYNGDVTYYVVDEKDPIAKTYRKIYPSLFRNVKEMPGELQSHIRYPNALFKIQAGIYSRYHMNNVKVFYQNEDIWDIANEIYGTSQREMTPNYYIVKLPDEQKAEFISSIPFTPKSKQNMTALMVAKNDGTEYGKLILYQFPKSKTVYGPRQIEAQIDQNTKISQDFSLWSSSGSKYSRGNLFVVPIKDSLLYIEPVYLEAADSAIPEVKRIIAVYDDKIAYESTLGDALKQLFGDGGDVDGSASGKTGKGKEAAGSASNGKSKKDYIEKAQKAYKDAQKAVKNGDWGAYGRYMDELSRNLDKLSE